MTLGELYERYELTPKERAMALIYLGTIRLAKAVAEPTPPVKD